MCFTDMIISQEPCIQRKGKNEVAAVSAEVSCHCAFEERHAVREKDRGAGVEDIRVCSMEEDSRGVEVFDYTWLGKPDSCWCGGLGTKQWLV